MLNGETTGIILEIGVLSAVRFIRVDLFKGLLEILPAMMNTIDELVIEAHYPRPGTCSRGVIDTFGDLLHQDCELVYLFSCLILTGDKILQQAPQPR